MKVTELITRAQAISGIGVFEGNAIEQNVMATTLGIFHQTLNSINNDPIITLWQETLDYQKAAADGNKFDADITVPFPISSSYPLPNDCRRVQRAFSRNIELRKTDYGEIERVKRVPGMVSMFGVNKGRVWLAASAPLAIVYAKQFPMYMPQDRMDLPEESLDYVVSMLSYNLALAFNQESAERCRIMAEKAYSLLKSNLSVNKGLQYQSSHAAFSRFSGRAGPWL